MEKEEVKKSLLFTIIGVVVIAGVLSALLLNQPAVGKSFTANLMGSSEVPPKTTMASGTATFMLSADGMTMTYKLMVNNITDTSAAHIHVAAAGVNGPVVVPLFVAGKPGAFTGILAEGSFTSANIGGPMAGQTMADLVAAIEAGNTYVNVHTTVNPGGEIRGQIMPGAIQ